MAGRKRLVEANAKTALGETSAALIGPGLAGLVPQREAEKLPICQAQHARLKAWQYGFG